MEELASVINNFARLILYAGGGVFTIAVCVAGFFYMTAFGDPQKQNIARGALVGAFVGVCIMGVSFLAPRIMSQFVLEPAGLEGVANSGNTGCDRTLRSALITQRGVGNYRAANAIVRAIQAQRAADCNEEIWNPEINPAGFSSCATAGSAGTPGTAAVGLPGDSGYVAAVPGTAATSAGVTIGNNSAPPTLVGVASVRVGSTVYGGFARDAAGNLLIEFSTANRPTDGSQCWLFLYASNYWDEKA